MALITNQQVLAQQNLIRHLIHEEFKTDTEIMKQLRINQVSYYQYKKRIQDEDSKIWDIIHQDSTKFRGVQLLADLEYTRTQCLKISQDPKAPYRERMESMKTACEASANIFKLLNEGLTFNVSIPGDKLKTYRTANEKVEEDKPKEDKDLLPSEPVEEHNNTIQEVDADTETTEISRLNKQYGATSNKRYEIPTGNESWGTSLQRNNYQGGKSTRQYPKPTFTDKPNGLIKTKVHLSESDLLD